MKYLPWIATGILLGCLLGGLFITADWEYKGSDHEPDQRTKELCRQYADRNHTGELAPSRVQWFADQGIDINKDFDWYESCLDHNRYPVAR